MIPLSLGQPVNLTAEAELLQLTDERGVAQVLTRAVLALGIHGPDGLENIASADADIIYVIIAGYGALHCDEGWVEFTAGDVIMVPSGILHHFQEVNPNFRTWRIVVTGCPEDHVGG